MSGSNCSFLMYKQVSQEKGKVVRYPHLVENFPQFVVIHIVKGFSIVNEAKEDVFLEFSCLFYDPMEFGNLMSVSLPFLNPACTSGSSQLTYCWSLAWRILSIILLACEMNECNCVVVWTLFSSALLWDRNENWPFPVWPLLRFPNLLIYLVQHFNSILF